MIDAYWPINLSPSVTVQVIGVNESNINSWRQNGPFGQSFIARRHQCCWFVHAWHHLLSWSCMTIGEFCHEWTVWTLISANDWSTQETDQILLKLLSLSPYYSKFELFSHAQAFKRPYIFVQNSPFPYINPIN